MTPFFRLPWLWVFIQLSRSQCVLEKEYFCSAIPDGFPEGLTSILFVVTNLGAINSTVFNSPNLASVTSLALANSGITRIEPGAFRVFQSLTKLSLYQNGLTHISGSWLSNPGHLENLTVAQNLISKIGPNTFSGFSNLTTLNLANNRIRQIDRGSFKGLSELRWLDLSNNNLTTLTRSVFNGPVIAPAMKLGSNPWNCSCELQDLGFFLQELINSSLLDDANSVICHSPPSWQGTHVWNISDFDCPPDFLSSPLENSFYYVGLPALLATLVFISFLALLCWIGMVKREKKQVQPCKQEVDSTRNVKPNSQVEPMTKGQQTEGTTRTSEMDTAPQRRMLKVRAKSASAILLRTEFHPSKWRPTGLVETTWERLMAPYVSLDDKMDDRRNEDLNTFMELWNFQNLEEGHEKQSQGHNETCSIPVEGGVEMPRVGVLSEATKALLKKNGISEAPEKINVSDHSCIENPEPFSYLTVATAPRQQTEIEPRKDMITEADKSQMVSLKRASTWPYARSIGRERMGVLSMREPFMVPFSKPSFHLDATGDAREPGSSEEWLRVAPKRKDQLLGDWKHEFSGEVKLPEGKEPLRQKRSKGAVEEVIDVGKSEFEEEQLRQHGPTCLGVYDPPDQGGTEINMETNPTRPPEVMLQKESSVAAVARYVHTSPSGIKPTRCPTSVRAKQLPKPVSSQSRVHCEVPPSLRSSVDTSAIGSSYSDDVLQENNEYNYMNLLHEVVENRGRWTRERWKQTHRNRALSKSK